MATLQTRENIQLSGGCPPVSLGEGGGRDGGRMGEGWRGERGREGGRKGGGREKEWEGGRRERKEGGGSKNRNGEEIYNVMYLVERWTRTNEMGLGKFTVHYTIQLKM